MSMWWYVRMQLCMMVNGVEQVRIAMLALPAALEFHDKMTSDGSDTSPCVVVKNTDDKMCRSLGLVANHIADKVSRPTLLLVIDNNGINSYNVN